MELNQIKDKYIEELKSNITILKELDELNNEIIEVKNKYIEELLIQVNELKELLDEAIKLI